MCNLPMQFEGIPMSSLQAIPEFGQLFLLGSGIIFLGVLLRLVRRVPTSLRAPLPSETQPEPRQS